MSIRNSTSLFQNLENNEAGGPQGGVAKLIFIDLLGVLTAIEFDDDPRFQAGKVANITLDRKLTAELSNRLSRRSRNLLQSNRSTSVCERRSFRAIATPL